MFKKLLATGAAAATLAIATLPASAWFGRGFGFGGLGFASSFASSFSGFGGFGFGGLGFGWPFLGGLGWGLGGLGCGLGCGGFGGFGGWW